MPTACVAVGSASDGSDDAQENANGHSTRACTDAARHARLRVHIGLWAGFFALVLGFSSEGVAPAVYAQEEPEIARPGPPPLEDFETDADEDGKPDGWYNLRDAKRATGGVVGPTCLRFENALRGRPARASRAFGVDGKTTEAIIIGLWIRAEQIGRSERFGEEPMLMIDFLGDKIRQLARGTLGPWGKVAGRGWVHVAKRIPVPPGAHDAIMSVGLMGSTGVLEVDGLSFELLPVGGSRSTNLIMNGDFELADPDPVHWVLEGGAQRVTQGFKSSSCIQLARSGAKAMCRLSLPISGVRGLAVQMMAKAAGLRGAGGASAEIFFLDDTGQTLPGILESANVFRWGGAFNWTSQDTVVDVPRSAVQAVLQVSKVDDVGSIRIDDVRVAMSPDPERGAWTPYHVTDDVTDWVRYAPSEAIEPGSALDVSSWLDKPAGRHGHVGVSSGRFAFKSGRRARFFGVVILPTLAFGIKEQADELAERLARSGVNLVRLGDLDMPMGPGLSLFDDSRDDTRALDPIALAKFDHLIAALKSRGIYIAIELQGGRRFREGDGLADVGRLPSGGGPAAAFDPKIRTLAIEGAEALLSHVNPETGLSLRNDPALVWVTLAGELSLFDLPDDPSALPPSYADALKKLGVKSTVGTGRKFWSATEAAQWKAEADALRKFKLKALIAGCSHWRHDPPEFSAAQAGAGLDLIDDRLFWFSPPLANPEHRAMLWDPAGSLAASAAKKRRNDRPFVVGQWCAHTLGAWASPYDAADFLYASRTARLEDWDALVRRGIYAFPRVWGAASPGTAGDDDRFVAPETVNGNPVVFSLLPHAASIFLRGNSDTSEHRAEPVVRGRLVVDTPYTQALAGWAAEKSASFDALQIATDNTYAVIAVTALGPEPIGRSKRLLVTAVSRCQPTGYAWADWWKREVADPGRPPLVMEPVQGSVVLKQKTGVTAFALENSGKRGAPAKLVPTSEGTKLALDTSTGTTHWEVVIEDK